jgi:ubiquitin carboxyl-terminal hydrolase MINDY-1/2
VRSCLIVIPLFEIVLIYNSIYAFHSQALARQLQAEEDAHARQVFAMRQREREEKEKTRGLQSNGGRGGRQPEGENQQKKDKCIVM